MYCEETSTQSYSIQELSLPELELIKDGIILKKMSLDSSKYELERKMLDGMFAKIMNEITLKR